MPSPPVRVLRGFFPRLFGLAGRRRFLGEAFIWIFPECRAVHTFGMFFPLDIAFFDRQGKLLKFVENAKPWRFFIGPKGTFATVEMPAGRGRALLRDFRPPKGVFRAEGFEK